MDWFTKALFEPNLLVNKKPVGPVVVDRTDPFNRALKHVILWNTKGAPIDLVTGVSGTVSTTGTPPAFVQGKGEVAWNFTSANDGITFADDLFLDCSNPCTIIFDIDVDSITSTYDGILELSVGTGSSNNSNFLLSSNASYRPVSARLLDSAGNLVIEGQMSGVAASPSGRTFIAVRYDGTTMDFFYNGEFYGYAARTLLAQTGSTEFGRYGTTNEFDGRYHYWAAHQRALRDDEIRALYNNRMLGLAPADYSIFPASGGGGAAALQGDANSTATSTGALTTGIQLAASAAATVSASGALTTQIPLNGAAVTITTASGSITTGIPLAASAVCVVDASGNLTAQIKLDANAIAQAVATGALQSGAAQLAGDAQAAASASGAITTEIRLAGDAIAQAAATGNLQVGDTLTGNAIAQAAASGELLTQIPLDGDAQAFASGSGNLTTLIQLSGAAASVCSATGELIVSSGFSADALAQAAATGELTTQIKLNGSAIAQAAASGILTTNLYEIAGYRKRQVKPENRVRQIVARDRIRKVAA